MPLQDRDYLLRQIERLAEVLAAFFGRVEGTGTKEVERELERVRATLLGPLRDGFSRLEPDSLVMLLGGAEKSRLVARVLELEADLREHEGDGARAARLRRQALALLDAVARKEPRAVDDAHRARVAALEAK
ncbi:MAG TPA: hypothetical protein VHB21_23345, partial [Minicystis sp.]|nr:hypothetical protein [Minicystis sp.]